MLTFAIGDIHGCRGLLADLLALIRREAGDRPHRIVCLGDYIDRGPDSAGVVRMLREREGSSPAGTFVCLKGNHEALLADAASRTDALATWLRNGGRETLASYLVEQVSGIPGDDLAWLAGRLTFFEDERRCFVHAGLNPAFPRDRQVDSDRLWIRAEFLESDHDFGRFVVHGHTPQIGGVPDLRPRRVNLDTGAVYGGRLTAGIFTDEADGPTGYLQVP